jgi:aminopeptidase N|tara:strand:- start:4149 stop:6788 length:2640 start_codon:yes stop_codon:yes gene_type:complete
MMMRDAQPGNIYLKDYSAPRYLIDKTALRVDIRQDDTVVLATLDVRRNPDANDRETSLVLDGQGLSLQSLSIDGKPLTPEQFSATADELLIHNVPEQFTLTSEVIIRPKENSSLEGLFKSRTIYCTQCEAEGFRGITYYLDRPDVMSEFTTTVVADQAECPVLLSNGNLLETGELPDGRHWATWHDPFLKPAYLFALVAGELSVVEDNFTTCSGRNVVLQLYVESKDLEKCDHAMTSLKNAMRWDEEVYGREYDLDLYMIVAVDDFNMGAMENKGLNIFNTSCVLAHQATTTDDGFNRVEAVVAHEYFHNWSGNRVTCRDWFQLSLKEGFTVFRDSQFSADMGSPVVKRVENVTMLRTVQFAEDGGPTAHPVQPASYMEISNFYTATIYEKGAEVVRMIHTLLGPELFRRGSDLYFERHDGQAVTIEDFVAAMAEVSGRDFSQFMNWYRQAGTPRLTVTSGYDEQQRQFKLHFSQSCPPTPESQNKQPFHIPVTVGLVTDAGDLPLSPAGETSRVVEITETEQTVVFEHIDCRPVPSLLRNFSAPVKLNYPYSFDELGFLMAHDSDGFNRWDAGQRLSIALMQSLIKDFRTGEPLQLDSRLPEVFAKVLDEIEADQAMQALVLTLPTEFLLAELSDVIDVEAIHQVRRFVCGELGKTLVTAWRKAYLDNVQPQYALSGVAMARRSLKNLSLRYLLNSGVEDSLSLAHEQFMTADNMTDRLAALSGLVNDPRDAAVTLAEKALDKFYQDWQQEPLVLNQWFQVQASCMRPGGLERVKKLMQHTAFDFHNPNKVRALVGVFCNSNPVNFHRQDGAGYQFLADNVLALDKLNPQIASRQLTPLTKWRRYDLSAQSLMQEQLSRVLAAPGLSRDTYEIASKSL